MALPTASELIFSEQANHNFSKTLCEIKRHTLSIHNRLLSILADSAFVQRVAKHVQRPLIANERCGSWYIDPEKKGGSAYFKSTDGHTGIWFFSTRRLNLHLLQIIGHNDGCIVVDSTRRGKRMPDALSKTIPIWCSVLNRALFAEQPEFHDLHTPPLVVSSSEHSQILARLDAHVQSFLDLKPDLTSLRRQISKPLRPIWITPESTISESFEGFDDYHPVICCTSSRRVPGGEVSEGGYIQGSGDDTENWAHGLTPPLFWSNIDSLLSTSETELPELIAELVSTSSPQTSTSRNMSYITPTKNLCIASFSELATASQQAGPVVIRLLPEVTEPAKWQTSKLGMILGIGPHKIGSKNLRPALPLVVNFITTILYKRLPSDTPNITIACSNGKDHSVGLALALLCLLYDDSGNIIPEGEVPAREIDKLFIRRRLGWIMTAIPDANPTRSTLQSVNSFLIDRPT